MEPGQQGEVLAVQRQLAELVRRCDSVRSCTLPWYLFSRVFSPHLVTCNAARCWPRVGPPAPEELQREAEEAFHARVVAARRRELTEGGRLREAGELLAAARRQAEARQLESEASAFLALGEGEGYLARPEVAPFLQQLRCYAAGHGIGVLIEERPYHPLAFLDKFGPAEAFAAPAGPNASWLRQNVRLLLSGQPRRALELARSGLLLATTQGSVTAWSKPWALERRLGLLGDEPASPAEAGWTHPGLIVAVDLDMTVRPDAHDVDLIAELRGHSARMGWQRGHHVYVRDTSPYTVGDCVNGGFVAVRATAVGRAFLRLWQEKLRWPGVCLSEQGALAETILEILMLEGKPAEYRSQCLTFLFPSADGAPLWPQYCSCWQSWVLALAGPYRSRQSEIVGFVDSARLDVNFVAHTFFPSPREAGLDGLRLGLGGGGRPRPLGPFIVHWAGLGAHKLPSMQGYLQRFNSSIDMWRACAADVAGPPGSSARGRRQRPRPGSPLGPAALRLRRLGSPVIPDAARRRDECWRVMRRKAHPSPPAEMARWWRGSFGCAELLPGERPLFLAG